MSHKLCFYTTLQLPFLERLDLNKAHEVDKFINEKNVPTHDNTSRVRGDASTKEPTTKSEFNHYTVTVI